MRVLLSIILFLCTNLHSSIFNSQSIVHPEIGENGMVVSQHYLATNIGQKILQDGGNAYDASIAVAYALAVVLPRAGNIGGGGFMVMYDKQTNKNFSIDYRETAPALATKDMYLNKDGTVNKKRAREGILAIGVPGTVYGMWEVHQKFGSLPWKKLIEPAIELAKNGFVMTPFMVDAMNDRYKKLGNYKFENIVISNHNRNRRPIYGLNNIPKIISPFDQSFLFEFNFLKEFLHTYLNESISIPNNFFYCE